MELETILKSNLDEGILYEAGLSRLVTHMSKPWAVLSAFRGEYDLSANRQRNRQLETILKSNRMGGIKLIGHWDEAPSGMDWKEAHSAGLTDDLVEESYFIPIPKGMDWSSFKNEIKSIVVKFNQDAGVISDGKDVYLIFKNGTMDKIGSGTSFNKVAQAYSTLRRKPRVPFVFEGTMQPSNNIHRMALKARGLSWFNES